MKFDLSVIIVNYNTKDLLLNCLKSIRDTSKDVNFEVIVIDNASTDGSAEALLDIAKKHTTISVIINDTNDGFAKANNQGIAQARGKYVLLLNSDTEVQRGALTELLHFVERHPDAGVVGAQLLNRDKTIQASCFNFPTITMAIREYFLGQSGLFDKYTPQRAVPQTVDAVVGAAFLMTPKALKNVGMLNERYFMYFEDIDYCRQVWKSGLKVYYLPSAKVMHLHGASGAKLADSGNQWRRLIPSSKIYHGVVTHYLLTAILWLGQKMKKAKSIIRS